MSKSMESPLTNNTGDKYDYNLFENTDKIFSSASKRHEDLKAMLDSNKDNLKLDAMKRVIGMVAKGKNPSHLFPQVVKNVASKNLEIKKLVYVYLVRYAEEQQDLALLSISTFQKGLKDPNQLIRASALRVLSSIRVPMISPIMMLAIKEGMRDMSPYVRKTAALAIPKLYKLDPELKESLIEVIEKLLADKSTLVVGSANMAFEMVCPEREDITKRFFSRMCKLFFLGERHGPVMDEWSCCHVIYTLTRFASRRLLVDPRNATSKSAVIFPKIGDTSNSTNQEEAIEIHPATHPDLKLLLKNCKPLLQSRNSAVVMSVVQLYYHCAPSDEMGAVVKPLIRLLRGYGEVQCVVLKNIITFCESRPYKALFEPYIKSFFVNQNDPTHIKLLKLEMITLLAEENNIAIILRELQTYVSSHDKEFASATIACIGKCAQSIPSIQQTCTDGLLNLMHSSNERVVSESVIVLKNLLKLDSDPESRSAILDGVCAFAASPRRLEGEAEACVLWLLCRFVDDRHRVARLPDLLRLGAARFPYRDNVVKLQILNLACKLYTYLTRNDVEEFKEPKHQKLVTTVESLVKYIFELAKYDTNYDVRDKARMLKRLLFDPDCDSGLKDAILGISPSSDDKLDSQNGVIYNGDGIISDDDIGEKANADLTVRDDNNFQLGSLSHYLNSKVDAYRGINIEEAEKNVAILNDNGTAGDIDWWGSDLNASEAEEEETGKKDRRKETLVPASEENSEYFGGGKGGNDDYEKFLEDSSMDNNVQGEEKNSETADIESDTSSSSSRTSNSSIKSSIVAHSSPEKKTLPVAAKNKKNVVGVVKDNSSTESSGNSSDSSDTSSDTEDDKFVLPTSGSHKSKPKTTPVPTRSSNIDALLSLDFGDGYSFVDSTLTPVSDFGACDEKKDKSTTINDSFAKLSTNSGSVYQPCPPSFLASDYTILNEDLPSDFKISYKLCRKTHIYASNMLSVELKFANLSSHAVKNIKFAKAILNTGTSEGVAFRPFYDIAILKPGQDVLANLGLDFGDSLQTAHFPVRYVPTSGDRAKANQNDMEMPSETTKSIDVAITAPLGEQMYPIKMNFDQFTIEQSKLKGLNETCQTITYSSPRCDIISQPDLLQKFRTILLKSFNMFAIEQLRSNENPHKNSLCFAAKTISRGLLVLLQIESGAIDVPIISPRDVNDISSFHMKVRVNCEKMIFGNGLVKEVTTCVKAFLLSAAAATN
ncbi:unnamed protein product [Gordionus sp. m RMFG-2023]|uniref:AP-3 complex subunit beta-2-like n=1 Tax=Gordionus sp. m RMFG-2023 TaxID=3053472 RepID=UPI0030E4F564